LHPPPIDPDLQRIIAGYGLVFGHRLLEQAGDEILRFRQFLDVAIELVEERPEDAAMYLAAMVAVDIQRTQIECLEMNLLPAEPSRN